MEEIEGIPLIFNRENDLNLFGKMFPKGFNFPSMPIDDGNMWKEEWKTRSPEEVQKYFFPEAMITQKNNITLCDTTGVFKEVKIGEPTPLDEILIEDFSHPRKILGFDNEDIVIWFFSSSDGARLLRAHRNFKESSSNYPDVLAVFMETDDGFNVFGSVMDFVVGENVKKLHKEDVHWKKVIDFIEKNEIQVNATDTKALFDKALSRESIFDYLKNLVNKLKTNINHEVFSTLAKDFSLIAEGFVSWKYEDKDWDNQDKEFTEDNAPFIFVKDKKYVFTSLKNSRLKSCDQIIEKAAELSALINENKDIIPDVIFKPLETFLKITSDRVKEFYKAFEENYKNMISILQKGPEYLNAFLCGFVNGFLDFISGIFSLINFLIQYIEKRNDYEINKGFYWSVVLEYIENTIQAMTKFNFIAFFSKIITLPLDSFLKLISLIQNISLPNVNFCKIAYFSGYILFGIVQIILEILFTGGSATLERLFAKGMESIKGFIKKGANLADDVFASLSKLINLIKSGAENFVAFLKKIIDDVFEWFENLFTSGKADEVFEFVGSGGNLKYLKILSRNMVAQEHSMSCAAACIRQLARDFGLELEERVIRGFARTTKQTGTFPDGILDGLKQVFKDKEIEAGIFYNPRISDIDMAKSISKEGSWISIVRPNGGNSHAIIIDKIQNGKVFIRDPWPIEGIAKGSGVEAIIDETEFATIWAQGGNYVFKVK